MKTKKFIHNFKNDQYKFGFYKDGFNSKKNGNAYYKRILKFITNSFIYLLGLFTTEIKQYIVSLFS